VRLTILYRHPLRPDEAGITVVADPTEVAEMTHRLEDRGYLVIGVVTATFAKVASAI
jgi:hypothetical protein